MVRVTYWESCREDVMFTKEQVAFALKQASSRRRSPRSAARWGF